jgi:L-alanine-DL-glutamate epimerase-like enolase superfamily enzyme
MAKGGVMNEMWDLWGRYERKPVWRVFFDLSPEEKVGLLPFDYILDGVTREEALMRFRKAEEGKAERLQKVLENRAVLAYSSSGGWLGYSDDKMESELKKLRAAGFTRFKIKIGLDEEEDMRRLEIARKALGSECIIMVDANQVPTHFRAFLNVGVGCR